ncbi:MAG: hypothetical protein M0P22_00295 [Methanoculleus sp.]|nr:hypothetical protein [Methanoculleus sp.]
MTYAERIGLYREIEEERGRPLITYITSSRPKDEDFRMLMERHKKTLELLAQ